jgi:hypothetical protein
MSDRRLRICVHPKFSPSSEEHLGENLLTSHFLDDIAKRFGGWINRATDAFNGH